MEKRKVGVMRVLLQDFYPTEEEAEYYGSYWQAHCAIFDTVLKAIKILAPIIVTLAVTGIFVVSQ
jgi:hypothetical protein